MMDVCTLIVINWMTLQACADPARCESILRDGKQICYPASSKPCPTPSRTFECKRHDGSTYLWTDQK